MLPCPVRGFVHTWHAFCLAEPAHGNALMTPLLRAIGSCINTSVSTFSMFVPSLSWRIFKFHRAYKNGTQKRRSRTWLIARISSCRSIAFVALLIFRTSVLTTSGAAPTAHMMNSVLYSTSVLPGQRRPGTRRSQPAPPVIRRSGSAKAYGRERFAATPSTSMIAAVSTKNIFISSFVCVSRACVGKQSIVVFQYKMAQKDVFRTVTTLRVRRVIPLVPVIFGDPPGPCSPCRNVSPFNFFYDCPEPILANIPLLVYN
jgi:hypothetical protein